MFCWNENFHEFFLILSWNLCVEFVDKEKKTIDSSFLIYKIFILIRSNKVFNSSSLHLASSHSPRATSIQILPLFSLVFCNFLLTPLSILLHHHYANYMLFLASSPFSMFFFSLVLMFLFFFNELYCLFRWIIFFFKYFGWITGIDKNVLLEIN